MAQVGIYVVDIHVHTVHIKSVMSIGIQIIKVLSKGVGGLTPKVTSINRDAFFCVTLVLFPCLALSNPSGKTKDFSIFSVNSNNHDGRYLRIGIDSWREEQSISPYDFISRKCM